MNSMSRLIDADALKPKFVHGRWEEAYISETELMNAPTVEPIKVGDVCKECWREGGNVVEVVRCVDCKHLKIVNKEPVYAECELGRKMFMLFDVDTRDFFCADGERRSE